MADPAHFPDCRVEPSPGSLSGQNYVGPGAGKIPNEGQMVADRMFANGLVGKTKFQAAKIRKPLLAVSSLNDKGNPVWFDSDCTGGSFILLGNAPELNQIRQLIQQVRSRVKMERKGGIFQLRNWAVQSSPKGFTRPVKP